MILSLPVPPITQDIRLNEWMTAVYNKLNNSNLVYNVDSDPLNPQDGESWFRSDLGIRFMKGTSSVFSVIHDTSKMVRIYDEFDGITLSSKWNVAVTGTATVALGPDASGGGCRLQTGATSGSTGYLQYYNGARYGTFNRLPIIADFRVFINGSVADIRLRCGFSQDATYNSNNSYYFELDSAASANWRTVSRNAATVETQTSTSVVAIGAYYHLRIIFKAGQLQFQVNGTTIATHETQVPVLSPGSIPYIYLENTAAANKDVYLDLVDAYSQRLLLV